MEDIVLISISKSELETIIEKAVLKVLTEVDSRVNIPAGDSFLTVKEAADFLDLAVQTLYGLTSSRGIPHFKRGKRIYFSRSALIDWLKERRVKTRSEIEQEADLHLSKRKGRGKWS